MVFIFLLIIIFCDIQSTLNQLKQDVADSRIRVVRAEDATRKHEAEKAALLNDLKLANEEVDKLRAANVEMEKSLAIKKQEVEDCKLAQQEIKESSIKSAVEEFSNLLNASKDSNQSTPRMKVLIFLILLNTFFKMGFHLM